MDPSSSNIDWARWALAYLAEARAATQAQFAALIMEMREAAPHSRSLQWFAPTKNIVLTLGHYATEFPADCKVPGERFGSPGDVAAGIDEYRAFFGKARDDLVAHGEAFCRDTDTANYPSLVEMTLERVRHLLAAADYVVSLRQPEEQKAATGMGLLMTVVRRFDEAVAALAAHPHGKPPWGIADEWDCQYLLRALLAGSFRDVRIEEANPSFAGAASRCEFFIKPLRAMIEVKFVRKATDQKRITSELALDIAQYGANPQVNHLIALVYDPQRQLKNPVQLQTDLSGPAKSLDVCVIVSPPR